MERCSIVDFLDDRVKLRASEGCAAMGTLLGLIAIHAVIANYLVATRAVTRFDRYLGAVGADHHPGEKAIRTRVKGAQLGLELLERRVY